MKMFISKLSEKKAMNTAGMDIQAQRAVMTEVKFSWWCSQGSILGPVLFNILMNCMRGLSTPSVSLTHDTKLGKGVDLLEGRKAMQRDLDRLDFWVKADCVSFKKAKCQVLHLGHSNPKQSDCFQREWLERCPEEKDLGLLIDSSWTWANLCPGGPGSAEGAGVV